MTDYYTRKLSAERLRRCYEIAPPRVRRYLESEIEHVTRLLDPNDSVLELGCGYGRVALRLTEAAEFLVGIDVSMESLRMAVRLAEGGSRCVFAQMDALHLAFADGVFDKVICVQNGVGAFGSNQKSLVEEAIRVTKPGGSVLLSSYADMFWEDRLEWFEIQSKEGLVGKIDYAATGGGVIACKDGFRAGRLTVAEFRALAQSLGVDAKIETVDESSVFCRIDKPR